MEIKLKIYEFRNLQFMLNSTPMTNTELARVMFKEWRNHEIDFISMEQKIMNKYEEDVEEEIKDETWKIKKIKTKKIPDSKKWEMDRELNSYEWVFNISNITFPAWKKVILDFPNVVKWIRWEEMINMYEDLKSKFIS